MSTMPAPALQPQMPHPSRMPQPERAPQPKRPARRAPRLVLALLAVAALYGIDMACTLGTSPAAAHTFATNMAMPFDLIVFVPLLFYFLVVRKLGLTPILVLPAIALGVAVSSQFVNPNEPSLLVPLAIAAPAVDLAVGLREGRRLVRAYRAAKAESARPLDWFDAAFRQLVPSERAAHMLSFECTIWWYLLRSWRRKPDVPEGAQAFFCHRKSGYTALVGVIVAVCAVEAVVMHLLVSQWSGTAAAVLTVLTVYSMAWIAGDARATTLNPLLVDAESVTLRWGASFSERIPRHLVERIETSDEPSVPKPERLNLGIMGARPCWVVFREPVEVRTFTGARRPVRAVNVSPDEHGAFAQAVLER